MYYRIDHFIVLFLIFCCACRPTIPDAPVALLDPGTLATELLTTDTFENYFDLVTAYDLRLQSGFKDSISRSDYRKWLSKRIVDWPEKTRTRLNRLLAETNLAVNKRFPGRLPDSVYLVLTDDLPYGPGVFFTRNNAIFIPQTDAAHETDTRLRQTLYHELFHLVSRFNPDLRPAMYALANFVPLSDSLNLRPLDSLRRLTNPDATRSDYLLVRGADFYLPFIYATPGQESAFIAAMNFGYFKVARDTVDSTQSPPAPSWVVTNRKLPTHRVVEATEANSDYLIHPEEILAEHFAALFTGAASSLRYPEECRDLEVLLKAGSEK